MNSRQTLGTSDDIHTHAVVLDHEINDTCVCYFPQCSATNSKLASTCCNCGRALTLQGRYRAIGEIGQGRYAKTYHAIDEVHEQLCVIKQFWPKDEDAQPRRLDLAKNLFQQEALILQRLGNHPQIPNLIAFFEEDNTLFLIQEFVSGQSLYQQVQRASGALEIDIPAMLGEMLPILDFIHSHHIVHRDIKLGNIIRSVSGKLWLIDFGAAYHKNLGGLGIAGTPGYAAPEQLQGRSLPASDLYSLAVTCVSLLTGHILDTVELNFYSSDEFLRCLHEQSGQSIQPWLAQTLAKMLQPNPEDRYPSAAAVLRDLALIQRPDMSVDYGRLQWLLAEEAYQAADQETWRILLMLGDRGPQDMLTVDAIDRIPFADLRILDQLWSTASGGRYGFGAQLQVYQRQGQIRDFDFNRWEAFAEQVGWCSQGRWLGYADLGFQGDSPRGHLPAVFVSLENRSGKSSGALAWWRLGFMSLMERFSLS